MQKLVIVTLSPMSKRLGSLLGTLLKEIDATVVPFCALPTLRSVRILFALSLDQWGQNPELPSLLRLLRSDEGLLTGCVAAMLIDSEGELYTKSTATALAFAANRAGAALVGRPLVEGVCALENFSVQARVRHTDLWQCYVESALELCGRLADYAPTFAKPPKLLVLHASNHKTSNTMAAWQLVKPHLEGICIQELGLRNGTVDDCSGCPYTMCLHFGEERTCFYGGVMVSEVYPAVLEADALLLLCPNYNDALSANLTAFVNRLTALYRQTPFFEKAVFAIVVSGYSGSDIVASQLISGFCMNKAFALPAGAFLTEMANAPGELANRKGIVQRTAAFAQRIREFLL